MALAYEQDIVRDVPQSGEKFAEWRSGEYTLLHIFNREVFERYSQRPEKLRQIHDASLRVLHRYGGKKRDSGIPKVLHSFDVALLAMGIDIPHALYPFDEDFTVEGMYSEYASARGRQFPEVDPELVIAGILHDLVEEGLESIDTIRLLYGDVVADHVSDVTYLKTGKVSQGTLHFEMAESLAHNPKSFYLKGCDIWSNVRTIHFLRDKVKQGVVVEKAADFQLRKKREYWEFSRLLMELRHPYSDQICDALFKELYPESYFEVATYIESFSGIYDTAETTFDLFERNFNRKHPTAYEYSVRFERPSVYRVFLRREESGYDDFRSISPTLFVSPFTESIFDLFCKFIRHYSFDTDKYTKTRTTSYGSSDAAAGEYFIPMKEGHTLRVVVSSPEDRWLTLPMAMIWFSNDVAQQQMFLERYTQYFKSFGADKDMSRLSREAGRNLMRVCLCFQDPATGYETRQNVYVPRRSTVYDLIARYQITNGDYSYSTRRARLVVGRRIIPLDQSDELFPRQVVRLDSEMIPLTVSAGLYDSLKLPEAKRNIRQLIIHGTQTYLDNLEGFEFINPDYNAIMR